MAGLVIQSFSRVQLFATPWTAARQASLSFTISQSLLKLMSIESVMPSNHLTLCRSLFLLFSIFPSITVFSSESSLHIRWPKYWSFSFRIIPSNERSGLISFGVDCFDLLAVQGTLSSMCLSPIRTQVMDSGLTWIIQDSLLSRISPTSAIADPKELAGERPAAPSPHFPSKVTVTGFRG